MIKDNLYKEYLIWFKTQFKSYPTEKYLMVSVIDELIAMRNEFQDKIPRPNILNYVEQEEVKRVLDRLKIITFDEFKNEFYKK